MVRFSYCEKTGLKKGSWTPEEDRRLSAYITRYGHWNWCDLPKFAGLARCGKSCRLRWMNYLRPNIKRGNYSKEEEEVIIDLHAKLGNRWSAIAAKLPGRTDNEIKNHWHTNLKKRSYKNSKPKFETKMQPLLTSESKKDLSMPTVFESSSLDSTWLQKISGCGNVSSSSSDTNSEIQLKRDRYMPETFEDLCETLCTEPLQVEDYYIEEDFASVGSSEFVLPDSPFLDFDDGYDMTSNTNELMQELLSFT